MVPASGNLNMDVHSEPEEHYFRAEPISYYVTVSVRLYWCKQKRMHLIWHLASHQTRFHCLIFTVCGKLKGGALLVAVFLFLC